MTVAIQKVKKAVLKIGMITREKEEAMKRITMILAAILLTTTPVLASSGQEVGGTSLLVLLFLGFGALIVVCQMVPSLMLFCSMLKGLFGSAAKDTLPKTGA
jgi:hypothetical protein